MVRRRALGLCLLFIGAFWQRPKQKDQLTAMTGMKLLLKSGAAVVPHPEKADRKYELPPRCGGEDAYFVEDEAGVLGVADGVGGWASRGVDPGIYSRQLMNFAAEEVRSGSLDPGVVLQRAHVRTTAEGSSTALVLALKSGKVRAANLGDSGFLHLRRGEVLFQSPPQQHSFNFPFQLAAPSGNAGGDSPDQADLFELDDIAQGDVLVLGTDGLFDNAFAKDIAAMVSAAERSGESGVALAERAAAEIARETALWANDQLRVSPFAVEAAKEGHRFRGGKLDDITVVVAVVGAEAEDSGLKTSTKPFLSRL